MFYKTTKPAIVSALNAFEAKKKTFISDAKAWADQFDGDVIFSDQSSCISIAGIVLNNRHSRDDLEYWTKPKTVNRYASWPRAKMPKVAQAAKLKEISDKYSKTIPEHIEREELFKAIGCNWGDFIFSGLHYFVVDGVGYFKTGVYLSKVDKEIIEILGSEFKAAKEVIDHG